MFTGIIGHLGKFKDINQSCYTFSVDRSFFTQLETGDSLSVNGICLTVIAIPSPNTFSVAVMPETAKRTMLEDLEIGDPVNLELPATPETFFSGHIVHGHIDGRGEVKRITPEGNSRIITVSMPEKLLRYVVAKGSIAVNGISLTVIEAGPDYFTVGITPYTWKHTMLSETSVGDWVNIEVDIIAKYVEKLLKQDGYL